MNAVPAPDGSALEGADRYSVAPWITAERLDDEVMAINLETGAYFALDDAAADAWTLLSAGQPLAAAADTMASRYGRSRDEMARDLSDFVSALVVERLLVADPDAPTGAGALPESSTGTSYTPLVVQKYDDLEELLRLDPVHEVDEAGWPVPRQA